VLHTVHLCIRSHATTGANIGTKPPVFLGREVAAPAAHAALSSNITAPSAYTTLNGKVTTPTAYTTLNGEVATPTANTALYCKVAAPAAYATLYAGSGCCRIGLSLPSACAGRKASELKQGEGEEIEHSDKDLESVRCLNDTKLRPSLAVQKETLCLNKTNIFLVKNCI
jgi:hypothetical protein